MSRKREQYLWKAGIMFILWCLALVLDWDILHKVLIMVLIYSIVLFLGRFIGSGDGGDE